MTLFEAGGAAVRPRLYMSAWHLMRRWSFFIAIFMHCLFLSEYSDRTGVVKLEIISIMGWVAIREATSIAIMERPEFVSLRRCYERIIRARIELEG